MADVVTTDVEQGEPLLASKIIFNSPPPSAVVAAGVLPLAAGYSTVIGAAADNDINTISGLTSGEIAVLTLEDATKNVTFVQGVDNVLTLGGWSVKLDSLGDTALAVCLGATVAVIPVTMTALSDGGLGRLLNSFASGMGSGFISSQDAGSYFTPVSKVEAILQELGFSRAYEVGDSGTVAAAKLDLSVNPTDGQTVIIGLNTYEFVDTGINLLVTADTNIAVVLGAVAADSRTNLIAAVNAADADGNHDTLLLTDGLTPAVANGTENFLADETGTSVRIRSADAPGGTVVAAKPNKILDGTAATWDIGNGANLSSQGGRAAGRRARAVTVLPVTTALITATEHVVEYTFTPTTFTVTLRDAAGHLKAGDAVAPADLFSITGNGIKIQFGGLGSDLVNTDVVILEVWGA